MAAHGSSVPLFWRLKKSKYMMVGSKCETCSQVFFPPKGVCSKCRSKGRMVDFQLTGNGVIETFSVIRVPPEGFEKAVPYAIAIIKLDEGTNISGQVVSDIDKVEIGKRVTPVFRKVTQDGDAGLIHYGTKWELAE